jgi:hypothetical protein
MVSHHLINCTIMTLIVHRDHHHRSPHLITFPDFTQWALWVATEIMKRETATERAEVITFFIKASEGCRELSDFLGCCAIFAGLCTSSVDRLRQTWSVSVRLTRDI